MIFDICFNKKKKVRLTMLLVLDNNSSMLGTLGMALLAKLFAYPLSFFFFVDGVTCLDVYLSLELEIHLLLLVEKEKDKLMFSFSLFIL